MSLTMTVLDVYRQNTKETQKKRNTNITKEYIYWLSSVDKGVYNYMILKHVLIKKHHYTKFIACDIK